MPSEGLKTTYSFVYSNGYEYMIPRPSTANFTGDIIIGGGLSKAPKDGLEEYANTDDTSLNSTISAYLHSTTSTYFGDSWGEDQADGRIRKEWTGIMGYSPDGFPYVGQVEDGLSIAASFQGHGMVFCWMCGRALVEMMQGREGKELAAWFPEAFRVSENRIGKEFKGRMHTTSMEIEDKAML